MTSGPDYPPPPHPNDAPAPDVGVVAARDAVKAPAIALIVLNALAILLGCLLFVWHLLMRLGGDNAIRQQPDAKAFIEFARGPTVAVLFVAGIVVAIVALIGSVQMLRLRSYGLAATAAVLSMVNIGVFCCCGLSVGAGIWALVVLMREDVRAAFNRP